MGKGIFYPYPWYALIDDDSGVEYTYKRLVDAVVEAFSADAIMLHAAAARVDGAWWNDNRLARQNARFIGETDKLMVGIDFSGDAVWCVFVVPKLDDGGRGLSSEPDPAETPPFDIVGELEAGFTALRDRGYALRVPTTAWTPAPGLYREGPQPWRD